MLSAWRSIESFIVTTYRRSSRLNEASRGKNFGGGESGRFVNGILDRVRKIWTGRAATVTKRGFVIVEVFKR